MGQKISIPQQNQPFRRQATLGGDVSFRNLSESKENNSVVMATVTKVYYKQGRVDFKLANTATDTVSEAGNGIGSAPIPVDFYGYKADGKVFGHYRPIQIGDRVAVAYLWGHQESPIILGVYPNQASSYEFVAPPFATDSGDDKDENVKEYALADRKINPDGNVTYRTGKGSLYQTLNGHSFALIDDSPLYDQLWLDYEHIGAFRDADNKEINPLTETAGEWLLVHEDNQEGENADNHRTRFYVNKHGEFQIILSKIDSMDSALVVEGSKDKGFTAQQLFDIPEGDAFGGDMNHRQPELDKAPTYVKFNLGGSNQVASIEASSQAESQAQTTNLSVKPDGVYINGKAISDLIYNAGNKNDQKISDITNDIDDINQHLADKDKSDAQKEQDLQKKWADYEQKVADNAKAASEAAKSAERAGDDAKAAGQAAVRAGDNAVSLTDDIKNKIIYYSSISKEKDVHIPGKYLIINTDTYIANGTIKTAYIEDGAISSAKIGSEAVGTAQIAKAAVGTLQVADGAIGTAQIKDLAVTDEKVGNLTFNHMIGQTLDANKINVKNISGDNISADTITANHLKIGNLSEISGDLGNITKGNISASDDPNKGVVIDGLDADDPDKYTASKKAALFREVNALNASYQATLAYAQSVGIDATALQQAQQAMSDGLSPLFMNMGETTTMDHNKVVELEKALQQAISDIQNQFRYQLGTTANGKSTIYSGSQQPAHPKENDLWMKDTGSGTDIEIYNGAGWVSPSLNVVNNMNTALKNMPKTFFQSAQPDPKTTQLNEGDLWYKLTKDSNGNFVYTYYKWDNSVHMWVKLLNNGEVTNQSDINDIKNNIIKNLSDQVYSVNKRQQANQNSINDIKNNIIKNLADTVNQNEQTSQTNYNQLTGQIKTAQTNAINTANANTANQINGIQVGGRNYLRNSDKSITGFGQDLGTMPNEVLNLLAGKTITISVDVEWSNFKSDGSKQNRLGFELSVSGSDGHSYWLGAWKSPTTASGKERVSTQYSLPAGVTFTINNNGANGYVSISGTGKVSHAKIEVGNKQTDWSPAPEDQTAYTDTKVGQVQNNLNNLNTDYQAKVKLLDSINGKVDKITGSVVLLDTNYDGIMISPKTGIVNTTTGNTNTVNTVLSGDHGFLISKTPNKDGSATEDIFHVDTDGNLTIKGDFVGGNISGVNFTGANLNLAGSMKVSGSILAGDDGKGNAKVVINNDGLNMTSGDINLGDDKGTHVHIANDGTLTANQANISGNITATKLLLNDPTGNGQSSINLGGKFMVDSQGNVTANTFKSENVTVTGGEIKGTTIDGNTLKGNNINGGTITATNINASTINGGTITGATINGSNIVGGKFSSKDYGINGPSVVDYDNKYVGYSSSKQMPNFYVTPQGELLASKVIRRNELNTQGSYNPYMRLNSLVSVSDNTTSSGRYTYHKVGTFYCESFSSGIDIIYNLTSDADANYGFSTYNGTSKICFVILDGTTKVDDGSVINVVLENEVDETTKMIDFTTSTGTKVSSHFYSSREWHYLYGALGDLQYSSVYDYLSANKSYEIGALVYQAAGDDGFFITPKDIGTKESPYPLTSFYSSEISPSGSVSLVHGDYNLDSVTIKDEEQLMQKSDIRRNLMTPDSIMLSTTTQANMMEDTYDPNKYYTSISSEGIEFSEMHGNGKTMYGNGKTSNPARLIFDGDNGSDGVYHDLYGNIWAQPTSWAYKWRDRNGDTFFQAPTDANSNFQFWIANAKNHGPIQIGWVHFGDSTHNWAGNVPAIYNTEGHLKGIALYDRYMIFFIDAFAYNATDKLMVNGDKPNVYEH